MRNGVDERRDGMTDETSDCAQARMEYVKEAAAAISRCKRPGISAGIVGFDESPPRRAIQSIDTHLADLVTASDGISHGGQTAIGRGLDEGKFFSTPIRRRRSEGGMVITDGHNNAAVAGHVA